MDVDHDIARHLPREERVVWRQRAPALRLATGWLFGLAFLLMFAAGGAAALAAGLNPATGASVTDRLLPLALGGVFSLIGWGGLIFGGLDIATCWSTAYVLTDRRVVVIAGRRATSYFAPAFARVDVDGGVIRFNWGPFGRRGGEGFHTRLVGVDDPRRVADLIARTLKAPAPAAAAPAPAKQLDGARDPFAAHLAAGERIVWRQSPAPLTLLRHKLAALPAIAFFSLGAILPGIAGLGLDGGGVQPVTLAFAAVFGAITVALFAAFVTDIVDGWRTHYALTDRRLIVATRGRVESHDARAFDRMERIGDTLRFAWGPSGRRSAAFQHHLAGLADAARAEALIVATLRPRG
jgi:hypothetical protein